MIVFAGITPHPPLLVPGVGKGEEKNVKNTFLAMEKFARDLAETEPDLVIIVSPHMIHFPHMFNVCGMSNLYGSFANFGSPDYEWHGKNDPEFAAEIVDQAEGAGLPALLFDAEGEYEVDHGVMVPLHFIREAVDYSFKVLPISYSIASRANHYSFGQMIAEVAERRRDLRVAIIASGDLSHRLVPGQTNEAAEFDKSLVELIKKGDDFSIANMEEESVEQAGECGYRSILILLGALSGRDYSPEVYSYEGPFGVGYMVANMKIKES
ncbi:MAG TPA: AmmeMemoRadiSam system protein B [bacterium]|nr:AmmeMemoRadiSam system protein B [bacterium]